MASNRAEPRTKQTEHGVAPDKAFRLFGNYIFETNAALGNGLIRFLEDGLDRNELKALFTHDRSDGEALGDLVN
ncbi:MAG: hypothetical protein VXZ82_17320 [Planctomycetota bacterium]|nr:hypothetical protein [Planctomycetota bacterium]